MQLQMPVLPQPLSLNPLKDMPMVEEVGCSAGFITYIQKWMFLINFSKLGKYLITC